MDMKRHILIYFLICMLVNREKSEVVIIRIKIIIKKKSEMVIIRMEVVSRKGYK